MRRILSLWLPRFATDRLRARLARERNGGWGEHRHASGELTPLVAATATAGRAIIAAVDERAAAAGLKPGMPVADGRAILPGLRIHPVDAIGDAMALERLADWCGRYTPWTAIDGGDHGTAIGGVGLWLDITGCAHLFGGEEALLRDLIIRLGHFGHDARAAIADAPGAAWAAARFIADPRGEGVIVAPRDARDVLAPLPVAALRLPPAMSE
ncbi:MAG: hypothetical protein ACREEE_00655, partial [Dongiaceae bacterium]